MEGKTEEENPKTFRKRFLGFVKRWGKRIALASSPIWLFHIGTQANYTRNDIANYHNPSQLRREFKEQFGIPLRGFSADIEERDGLVGRLAQVVNKEKAEGDFSLNCFRFESPNYLKKSIPQQFDFLTERPHGGLYFPSGENLDKINLFWASNDLTFHHEIKHAKTYQILEKHPELLDRWRELAKDENGNSLYRPLKDRTLKRIRLLHNIVGDDRLPLEECIRQGFVSDYARTNVIEDIAELCTAASYSHYEFKKWLFDEDDLYKGITKRNEKISAKVDLAEEYGLIPAGFREYVELKRSEDIALATVINGTGIEKANEFLRKSQEFLENHPDSVYECELRKIRGVLLEDRSVAEAYKRNPLLKQLDEEKKGAPESASESIAKTRRELLIEQKKYYERYLGLAINEYKQALKSKFKPFDEYGTVLICLKNCYGLLVDEENARLYDDANTEHCNRRKASDIFLTSIGVNDFLESRGVTLDPHEQRSLDYIGGGK